MSDDKTSGSDSPGQILDRLYRVIDSRRKADPAVSNTARLFQKGTRKIAQKVGEEAVEVVIEAVREKRDRLIAESADLMYHLLVMWADARINPAEVWEELARREGVSGVAEKQSRANGDKDKD
jgi:phosphoribosyl-ATP pyrophosphohydrolase